MQWIVTILLILAVFWFFVRKNPLSNGAGKQPHQPKDSETMVACDACGVYTSLNEMILQDGKHFCSKECARK